MCLFDVAYAQEAVQPAQQNLVTIKSQGGYRYVISNGLPVQGAQGAANQEYTFRMNLSPKKLDAPGAVPTDMYFGVALDGVPFDTYAGNQKTDEYGGFINADRTYVYANIPQILLNKDLSHVGYAADGVPIFVSRKNLFKTSYDAAGKFKSGSGNLDVCNGVMVNDKYYIYVMTGSFPNVPLCWSRAPDPSFYRPGHQAKISQEKPLSQSGFLKERIENTQVMIERNRIIRSHR